MSVTRGQSSKPPFQISLQNLVSNSDHLRLGLWNVIIFLLAANEYSLFTFALIEKIIWQVLTFAWIYTSMDSQPKFDTSYYLTSVYIYSSSGPSCSLLRGRPHRHRGRLYQHVHSKNSITNRITTEATEEWRKTLLWWTIGSFVLYDKLVGVYQG